MGVDVPHGRVDRVAYGRTGATLTSARGSELDVILGAGVHGGELGIGSEFADSGSVLSIARATGQRCASGIKIAMFRVARDD